MLKEDINIGVLTDNKKTLFHLPKGITVKDVSPRGFGAIGQFEANRFEIVITTNRQLVDYNINETLISPVDNYYTADSDKE